MSALFVRYGVGSCRWRHVLNSVALPSESQVKTNRGAVYRRYAQSSHGREKVAAVCNERRLYCRDPWAFQWILQFKKKKSAKFGLKGKVWGHKTQIWWCIQISLLQNLHPLNVQCTTWTASPSVWLLGLNKQPIVWLWPTLWTSLRFIVSAG